MTVGQARSEDHGRWGPLHSAAFRRAEGGLQPFRAGCELQPGRLSRSGGWLGKGAGRGQGCSGPH
jgi:hypothetical protein